MTYFLDLFAGIGGFALGAYWAGLRFNRHYFSEVDPYAIRTYRARFPDAVPLGDVTKINVKELPHGDWIIAGGFPCQDISVAGKGAGLAGERSGLWYEYARIIGELRPRFAIMENVGALAFRGLDSVLGSLAALGYDAEWQDIRASDVGAPHRRERLWIVAYPDEERGDGAGRAWDGRAESADGGSDVPNGTMADSSGDGREPRRAECSGFKGQAGAVWSGASLADAMRPRLVPGAHGGVCVQEEGSGPRDEQSERCGEAMADSSGERCGEARLDRGSPSDGRREWWATEPDMGRSLDGLPSWLDRCIGRGVSNAENTRRVEALRALWSDHVSKTLRRAIGGFERIQQAEILFSFLRQYENGIDQARLLVEGKEVDDDFLRSLRRDAMATGSPYRPEQGKQSTGEYPDTVQMVPRILALDSAPNWAGDSWEDAIPRVAHKIPARVDRLKCLGNSIVPQIAELIFTEVRAALERKEPRE